MQRKLQRSNKALSSINTSIHLPLVLKSIVVLLYCSAWDGSLTNCYCYRCNIKISSSLTSKYYNLVSLLFSYGNEKLLIKPHNRNFNNLSFISMSYIMTFL